MVNLWKEAPCGYINISRERKVNEEVYAKLENVGIHNGVISLDVCKSFLSVFLDKCTSKKQQMNECGVNIVRGDVYSKSQLPHSLIRLV